MAVHVRWYATPVAVPAVALDELALMVVHRPAEDVAGVRESGSHIGAPHDGHQFGQLPTVLDSAHGFPFGGGHSVGILDDQLLFYSLKRSLG